MLKSKSGLAVGSIGQGTWHFGEEQRYADVEAESLKTGITRGMNLIDTAEMYGDGGAELVTGRAIRGISREDLYLVSKIYPHNANKNSYLASCEKSLLRLNTDYLDLYLLHWRGSTPLPEVVWCMEDLKRRGMILDWGVSNFDTKDMEELFTVERGRNCVVNQVLYHLGSRGIEYSLLPWLQEREILTMAYCPLAQAGDLKRGLFENKVLKEIARSRGATVAQILLAFLLTRPLVLPIPRTRRTGRAIENAEAMEIRLSGEELNALDREFPPPKRKLPLDIT
ncbi:MAG: aldo/keto reductase [Saccharofermentanales bacterium]|jgi:diketogulonate reductase-like aldo/keto reductase